MANDRQEAQDWSETKGGTEKTYLAHTTKVDMLGADLQGQRSPGFKLLRQ